MDWTILGVYLLLTAAAAVGGAVNALAGGGTLVTFPVLNAVLGVAPEAALIANATSKVGLVPGAFASILGFRSELDEARPWLGVLFAPAFVGALVGSVLLLSTSAKVFTEVVPWLILLAAILFTFQPSRPPVKTPTSVESSAAASGGESARKAESDDERASVGARWIAGFSQFLIGVYGGYFGAGLGILTLAVIGVLGLHDIHRMNALKVMLASLINGVSGVVLVIVAYDRIAWSYVAAMCIGSVLGGYWAAHWSRVIDKQRLRRVIAGSSFVLAGIYFALEFWI